MEHDHLDDTQAAPVISPDSPQTIDPGDRALSAWTRFWAAAPAWPGVAGAGIILGIALWRLRMPQEAFRGVWVSDWYIWTCLVALVPRAIQLLARFGYEQEAGDNARRLRARVPAWPFLLALLVVASYAAHQRWPFEAAFRMSQPSLDAMVKQVSANAGAAGQLAGREVGTFRIQQVDVLPSGAIAFFLTKSDFLSYGFVYAPAISGEYADADVVGIPAIRPHWNSLSRIRANWFILYSTYLYGKTGWS